MLACLNMPLAPGCLVGQYEVVALLGAGGMGEVYRARDRRLGREVAIKVLASAGMPEPGLLQRLQQEARTLAGLNHPNLLAIFDLGEQEGAPFLVMELLEGETLRARLRPGPLPLRRALAIARQVAQGLAAAHEQGIIHRDLKPENIFLLNDGRAKILDFGLAKAVRAPAADAEVATLPGDALATLPGMVLGTVGYMAPEQVRGEAATPRSDIFALGAVFYEMLAGKRAFGATSSVEVMSAILRDDPSDIVVAGAALPPAVTRILRRCLEKEPRQRFQTAADLEFALAAVDEASSSTLRPAGAAPAPAAAPQRRGRARLAALLLAGAVAGAALTALFALGRGGPDPTQLVYTLFEPGVASRGYWSPDGAAVAYAASPTANQPAQVFLRYLHTSSATQLTHIPNLETVRGWSGDGHSVLYSDTRGGIWSVSAVGGAPQKLYDFGSADVRALALSPQAWAVLRAGPDRKFRVFVSPPGGAHWTAYAPAPFATANIVNQPQMAFAPDGKSLLLFLHGDSGRELAWLLPYPADPRRPPHTILRQLGVIVLTPTFAWMPDSRHLLVAAVRHPNQSPQLFLAGIGGAWRQLTSSVDGDAAPTVSPDGAQALFLRFSGNFDVVAARLSDAVVSPLLANGTSNNMPAWALRQPALVYETDRNGEPELWLHATDAKGGASERRLRDLPQGSIPMAPALSPNADRVLYSAFLPGKSAIPLYLASVAQGSPVPLLAATSGIEVGANWSPDGDQASFLSLHGNQADLMVAPTSGQATARKLRTVSSDLTLIPVWSPDGAWIAYQAPDGDLHLVAPDGARERNLGKFDTPAVAFSPDSQRLYGVTSTPGHNYLVQLEIASRAHRRLGDLGADFTPQTAAEPGLRFTLTPDGQSLAFNTARRSQSLWMMRHFDPAPSGIARLRALLRLP